MNNRQQVLVASAAAAAAFAAVVCIDDLLYQNRQGPGSDSIHEGGPLAAAEYAQSVLSGSETRFKNILRLDKTNFKRLVMWLRAGDHLRDTRYQTVEQKLMIFLFVMAHGASQRQAAHFFFVTQSSVSRSMDQLLTAMVVLHQEVVRQPDQTYVSSDIEIEKKYIPLTGCIGAIDGTLIKAHVPLAQQKRFFSRKGEVSQNVLAAVRFDGTYTYVLAGAEGSLNDASLMRQAVSRNFEVPRGRFYLGDAGFACERGILTPYPGERYHINETRGLGEAENEKDLYNRYHAGRRAIVEHTFGWTKRSWKILRSSPPEYSFAKQIKIVYAATGLYNFVQLEAQEEELTERQEAAMEKARRRADRRVGMRPGKELRDRIARRAWRRRNIYFDTE